MTAERWAQVQELFYRADELPAPERAGFLAETCGTDTDLHAQVLSLLTESSEDTRLRDALSGIASAALAETSGSRIGPYRIERQIGAGGMGAVYLATRDDDQYRKQVAIKILHAGIAAPELLSRFRSERQILANLDHPNIARLLDGGATSAGLPYVVMEFIGGVSIDEFCRARKLDIRSRLLLFRQLCDAVAYAHRNLVVHRDIKPANVLVTEDGTPKLLDFGIARLIASEGPPRTEALTQVAERMMTPEYASPEQVRGEPVTTASDVYSLGVLLYELLTGERPFRLGNTDPAAVRTAICETDAARPSSFGTRELRGDIDNVVLMAMRKEAARRYPSVDRFSDDIRRYLEGFPVLAREDTWNYRAGKFVRRHRAAVAAAAIFVLLILAFATGMGILARRVAAERDRAAAARSKAEEVSRFLIDSFRVADRSGQQGRTVTAQEVLDRGSEQIFRQLNGQPDVRARMMNTMGEVYESLGLYDRAGVLLSGALKIRRAVPGLAGDELAESLFSSGGLAVTRGDNNAAIPLYREALKTAERGSAMQAAAQASLGSALAGAGKMDEARTMLAESLALRGRLFGRGSVEAADSLQRIGRMEHARERFADAEGPLREALAIRRRTAGRDSPVIASALLDLAGLLVTRGNLNEAESLEREALALHSKLYGESHILVADDLAALASVRFNAGNFPEAAALNRQAMAIYEHALGPDNPKVADTEVEIGNALERAGQLPEAERLIRDACGKYVRLLGERHPTTVSALHNLVNVLHDQGRNEEGERIMNRLILWQRESDPASPALAFNLAALGGLHRARGDFRAADRDYTEALAAFRKAFGEHHFFYARALSSLALNKLPLGDAAGAEPLLKESIAILRAVEQTNALDLSFPLLAMAQTQLAKNRPAEAEPYARESYHLRRNKLHLAPADLRVAMAESVLGGCLAALHRDDEAEPLLVESNAALQKLRSDKSAAPELARLAKFRATR